MSNYSPSQWAKGLGLAAGIWFIGCFTWGNFISDPVLYQLHIDLLRMSFIGFTELNAMSFVLGLVQSAILGAITGWLIATCLNIFSK